jgi:cAMP-dependent protein kinase regulator
VLYIVESGNLKCTKVINGKETFLKNYQAGDVFGELALLYNAPRAATIIAESDAQLWVLDRNTFNHIVKDASQQKRQKFENFLSSVPILQNMDTYERSKLADCIREKKIEKGQKIINQGDSGNEFYILVEGHAEATLNSNPDEGVMEYSPGDYFGELALLRNEPRAANVIARA